LTIKLRAHHLLCMLTYIGRGYTPAFTANYDIIIERLGAGEAIELIDGPDDICGPLLTEAEPHCHRDSVLERDRLARLSITELLQTDLTRSFKLDEQVLAGLRAAFSTGHIRPACSGCEWVELCDSVAQSGYSGVRLTARLC
jgi:hypothetical protein